MKQLLNSLDDTIKQKHDWTILDTELEDILKFIDVTSTRAIKREHIEYQSKSRLRRTLTLLLPKPHTIGGWIATIIYYLYTFLASIYILMIIFLPAENGIRLVALFGLIGSIIFALIARHFAIRSAKKSLARAKEVSESVD